MFMIISVRTLAGIMCVWYDVTEVGIGTSLSIIVLAYNFCSY